MKLLPIYLLLIATVALGQVKENDTIPDADWGRELQIGDWRPYLKDPITDEHYRDLAERIRQSKVPTEEEARAVAVGASADLDARATFQVTALLRLGVGDEELGDSGDFVWEVRVIWLGGKISGLVWVGAATGKAKVMFPALSQQEEN